VPHRVAPTRTVACCQVISLRTGSFFPHHLTRTRVSFALWVIAASAGITCAAQRRSQHVM
jgi:hypothetical protein